MIPQSSALTISPLGAIIISTRLNAPFHLLNLVQIIIIIMVKRCWQHGSLRFSLSLSLIIGLYQVLFLAGPLDGIQCLQTTGRWTLMFLWVGVHRRIKLVNLSLHLQKCPERFARWEANGQTNAILQGAAPRIHSKMHTAFLCCFHVTFPSKCFVKAQVVQLYFSNGTVTNLKDSRFIVYELVDKFQSFSIQLKNMNSGLISYSLMPNWWGCRIHWLHLCRGVTPPNECPWHDSK